MQLNECVGARLPTQLPNLVVNVLFAVEIGRKGTGALSEWPFALQCEWPCRAPTFCPYRWRDMHIFVDCIAAMARETGVKKGAR